MTGQEGHLFSTSVNLSLIQKTLSALGSCILHYTFFTGYKTWKEKNLLKLQISLRVKNLSEPEMKQKKKHQSHNGTFMKITVNNVHHK